MMPNKILYDSRWIGPHGIGRFAKEVFAGLENTIAMPNHSKPSSPFDPFYTSHMIHKLKPDFYFSPGYNPPLYLTTHIPYVFTLHDLIHLEVKAESNLQKKAYYEFLVKPAIHKAYKVFTVSHHAKERIIEWSGAAADKIVVVGNGVSEAFNLAGPAWQSHKPYFLYVGNHKPHKNIDFLLKAYRLWPLHQEVDLYFSGEPESGLDQQVHFIGKVEDAALAEYYRGAIATVIPSLYEGFGLPALESMACGTPVIAANQTSLPEVVGEGGIYINPYEIDTLIAALNTLYHETALRAALSKKAHIQSQRFSWQKTNAIIRQVFVKDQQQ